MLANDKGDNDVKPGLCTGLLAFALRLRKTQLGEPSHEDCAIKSSPQMGDIPDIRRVRRLANLRSLVFRKNSEYNALLQSFRHLPYNENQTRTLNATSL